MSLHAILTTFVIKIAINDMVCGIRPNGCPAILKRSAYDYKLSSLGHDSIFLCNHYVYDCSYTAIWLDLQAVLPDTYPARLSGCSLLR